MQALLDTSFWIDFHRGAATIDEQKQVERIGMAGGVILYQFVWLELQMGYRSENEKKILNVCRQISQWSPIEAEDARKAGDFASILRSRGTPIAAPDVLIMAAADRLGARLIHHDAHFTRALSHPEFSHLAVR